MLLNAEVAGNSISKLLDIKVKVSDAENSDLWLGIRSQLTALLDGLDPKDLATMSLGLAHSLSRCVCVFNNRGCN